MSVENRETVLSVSHTPTIHSQQNFLDRGFTFNCIVHLACQCMYLGCIDKRGIVYSLLFKSFVVCKYVKLHTLKP